MTFSFRNTTVFSFLLFGSAACVPLGEPITGSDSVAKTPGYYAQRTLYYEDHIYNDLIKTVQCYAATGTAEEILTAPVIPISHSPRVVLEFDELSSSQQRFKVKLVHCDANWKPSNIADIQFANDYNEYYITDIRPSGNTKVPYFHYRFTAPVVKISGNYLLSVMYDDGSYALTQRYMVYENLVSTRLQPELSVGVSERFTHQQINFDIFYPRYELVNPTMEVKTVLRQNHRWDNAKFNLAPTFVHDAQRQLEYKFYDMRSNFPGFNEFRAFDMRSLRYTGLNLQSVTRETPVPEVLLQPDKSRATDVYARYPDINGKFVLDNRGYGSGATEGDYAWVSFQLKADQVAPGNVYLFGMMTGWKLKPEFKMTFDPATEMYTGKALLKQGYYNYYYALQPANEGMNLQYFENSFADTENIYDLLVYYRPPGSRADLLISYASVNVNSNR